ncbi:MAG: caspase family protein [Nannocystis sp.]|nr:caspase family protein [Nannocystis sp.]
MREIHAEQAPKLALLVSAPNGLKGPPGDVAVMAAALAARRFECVRVEQAAATRAGILGALGSLARRAPRGGQVVFYYSGHGARVELPSPQGALLLPTLLPTDLREGGVGDFRGILTAELEVFFEEIVAAGARLSVIMDCCHAAAVVRGTGLGGPQGLAVRTLSPATPCLAGVVSHYQALSRSAQIRALGAECSPGVLRLVASGPAEPAFERAVSPQRLLGEAEDPVKIGEIHGVMTAALVRALAELAGRTTAWSTLARRVRTLAALGSRQQVMLRGPRRRLVWQEGEAAAGRWGGFSAREGELWVDLGAMCGVESADLLQVWSTVGGEHALGTVRAVEVSAAWSRVEVVEGAISPEDPRLATATLSLAAAADRGGPPRARALVAVESGREALITALQRSLEGLVDVSAAGEGQSGLEGPVALRIADAPGEQRCIELRRGGGGLLRERVFVRSGAAQPLEAALLWAAESIRALRTEHGFMAMLRGGAGARLLEGVRWTVTPADDSSATAHTAGSGQLRLAIGQLITLEVEKIDGQAGSLWVWVFWIGGGGAVSLLSSSWPRGAEISCMTPLTIGTRPDGARVGVPLPWPLAAPRPSSGGDGRCWLALVVADGPSDLTRWHSDPIPAWRADADPLASRGGIRGRSEPLPGWFEPGSAAQEWAGARIEVEVSG